MQGRKAQVEARPAAVPARAFAYDAKRESVLEGTVMGYTEGGPRAATSMYISDPLRTYRPNISLWQPASK